MSTVNYEQIRQRNIEEYGKGTRHLAYLSDLYSTRTHFLYELLQNAEDALRKRECQTEIGYVEFRLHEDRLEFLHNGKPFDEGDVTGICGIGEGTKSNDFSQIGKFGIGFKSVYAYTVAPRIHSSNEHFEIHRFVEPHALDGSDVPAGIKVGETCIILPFHSQTDKTTSQKHVPPDKAVSEISEALKKLGLRTLLFLSCIKEIRWSLPDGTKGVFQREARPVSGNPTGRYIDVTDGNVTETWLVFSRKTEVTDEEESHVVNLEVAYLVREGKVIPAQRTELVVFFPTSVKTELGYLIQGPFKTTKARDNIKIDDSPNRQMIEAAAQLTVDSLEELRDLGLLQVESYNCLPLRTSDFLDDSFFRPIYDKIHEAMKTKVLLPRHGGGFVSATESRLARGAQLADIFSPEQLGQLMGGSSQHWLDTGITADRTPDLHAYLAGRKKQYFNEWIQKPLIVGMEIEAKDLANKMIGSFFEAQEESWLVKFYDYMDKSFELYRKTPFVRLEDGKHVSRDRAYLPPSDPVGIDPTVFPLVKQSLVERPNTLKFLRDKAQLREPDAVDVIIKCLLPKYRLDNLAFNLDEYRRDLQRIVEACNDKEQHRLEPELKTTKFIACIPAGKPESGEVIWKCPGDTAVFSRTPQLKGWFADNDQDEAWFIHPAISSILKHRLCDIEVVKDHPLFGCDPMKRGKISIVKKLRCHKQGLDGFHPEAQILGLYFALENWNRERAIYLWSLLLKFLHLIKGDIQEETNENKLDGARRKPEFSIFGKACVEYAWLPDKEGRPHKLNELLLSDLPDGFDSESFQARELAEKLGMRKPEQVQALEELAQGDPRRRELLERIASASEEDLSNFEKFIPREVIPQPMPQFKEGFKGLARQQEEGIIQSRLNPQPPSNPNRYQKMLDDKVEDAKKAHSDSPYTVTSSPVRDRLSNSQAREFLYSEYQGHCQITGNTFPKASVNAEGVIENYFEAYTLYSYQDAGYLNDAGNMLCVSADTMAKFKHAGFEWLDDLETTIEEFDKNGEKEVSVRVLLAETECTITWSHRHFRRLVALWKKA
jgi:hypothetical protein